MGILTLAEYRTDIEAALGSRAYGTILTDQWTNSAYYEVSGVMEHPEMFNTFSVPTVASTSSYAGPTNSIGWRFVEDVDNDTVLEFIALEDFYRRSRVTEGVPDKWTRTIDTLVLHPTPNAIINLKIHYTLEPTALSSSGHKTILPAMWDHAVFLLAVERGHLHAHEENRAALWRNNAVTYIQGLMTQRMIATSQFDLAVPQGA